MQHHVRCVIEAMEQPLDPEEEQRLTEELEQRTPPPQFRRSAGSGKDPVKADGPSGGDSQDLRHDSPLGSYLPQSEDLYVDMMRELESQILALEAGRTDQVPAVARSWACIQKVGESAQQFTLLDYCESVHEAMFVLEAGPAKSIADTVNRFAVLHLEAVDGQVGVADENAEARARAGSLELSMDVEDDLSPYLLLVLVRRLDCFQKQMSSELPPVRRHILRALLRDPTKRRGEGGIDSGARSRTAGVLFERETLLSTMRLDFRSSDSNPEEYKIVLVQEFAAVSRRAAAALHETAKRRYAMLLNLAMRIHSLVPIGTRSTDVKLQLRQIFEYLAAADDPGNKGSSARRALAVALGFLEQAETVASPTIQFVLRMAAIEALLGQRGQPVIEALSKRAAVLVVRNPKERHDFITRFKALYEARSSVVHGHQFEELRDWSEDLYVLSAGIVCQFTHALMLRERAGDSEVKQPGLLADFDRLFNGGEAVGELPPLRPLVTAVKGGRR